MSSRSLRLRLRRTSAFLVTMLGLATTSCGDGGPTAPQLDFVAAQRRWLLTAPPSYDITVVRDCFCAPDVMRPVVVSVRNGTIASRRYLDTGADLDPIIAAAYPDVVGLFKVIGDAFARNADRVTVSYDGARGFPTSIAIDYSFQIADEESFYGTRDFAER